MKPRRQTGVGGHEPPHLLGIAGDDHHELVAEILHVLQQRVDGVLAERVALVLGDQPVGLVDEQHPAQGVLADLLHALRGLRHEPHDEVLLGDLHDLGARDFAQPEQDFGDDAREGGLGGAGRTFQHHVVFVGARRVHALLGQQLVDLNLGAPHRDLLFGPVQPDQLVEAGLRLGQHRVLLGGQRVGVALARGWFRWPDPTCRCGWRWCRRR